MPELKPPAGGRSAGRLLSAAVLGCAGALMFVVASAKANPLELPTVACPSTWLCAAVGASATVVTFDPLGRNRWTLTSHPERVEDAPAVTHGFCFKPER